jgi:hypothetical protein
MLEVRPQVRLQDGAAHIQIVLIASISPIQ